MKKGYLLIGAFALWCFACAIWYLFGVKGASHDPVLFQPQPVTIAIIEILVMMLGSFLLGFGLSWVLREPVVLELREKLVEGMDHLVYKERELAESQSNVEVTERRLRQADERILSLIDDNENRMKETETERVRADEAQRKIAEQESRIKNLDGDASSSRFRVRLLENELAEKETLIESLKVEISKHPVVEHRDWSDHPFVRPVKSDEKEKDDLTQIKGIGPVSEKKLNSLDIYNFRQISEMDGEAVTRLAEAIEVFPDRIHRDNWIGQATKLYAKKMGE
jgi:predicted flap endonuclease-1-like 5' DNA nuclease